ncbi:MAG: MmcQ/YjbR family DNA-binding protein [Muribaculum sp.]|nr:MmcQ/YjbR family DNA-binding protein [Muribaculum sp.]
MNCEDFRNFCLSLPEVTEKMPFQKFKSAQNILAFYVNGHIFCFYDIEKMDECTVKCHPEQIGELKASYKGIIDPYNLSHKYWIGVHFNSDVPDEEIRELVRQSYDIVKSE